MPPPPPTPLTMTGLDTATSSASSSGSSPPKRSNHKSTELDDVNDEEKGTAGATASTATTNHRASLMLLSRHRPTKSPPKATVVAHEILPDGNLEDCSLEDDVLAVQILSRGSQGGKQMPSSPLLPPLPTTTTNTTPTTSTIAPDTTITAPAAALSSSSSSLSPPPPSHPIRSFWVDIEIPHSSLLRQCLAEHRLLELLPPFLRRHLLQKEEEGQHTSQLHIPQTLILPKAALIVLRLLPNDAGNTIDYTIRHAAAICLRGLLITITTPKPQQGQGQQGQDSNKEQSTSPIIQSPSSSSRSMKPLRMSRLNLFQHLETDTRRDMFLDRELPEGTITGALSLWLQVHLERVSSVNYRLRNQILDLCQCMEQEPQKVVIDDIVVVKDAVLRIQAVAEEQDEVLTAISKGQGATIVLDFTTSHMKAQLRSLLSSSGATERTMSRMDKRIGHVRTQYEALQQDRINHRLNVLTILSAVFLPLTLMAGVWGMNFTHMPELQKEHAYYYALSSMVTVAVMLLSIFWKFGWFT